MATSNFIAGIAALVALGSFWISVRDRRRQQHEALLSALQGEKEAVAFVAFQLRNRNWGRWSNERKEILSALVVAWIFENSDRARAMVFSALSEVSRKYPGEVEEAVDDIEKQLENYVARTYPGEGERQSRIGKYIRKLALLRDAVTLFETRPTETSTSDDAKSA